MLGYSAINKNAGLYRIEVDENERVWLEVDFVAKSVTVIGIKYGRPAQTVITDTDKLSLYVDKDTGTFKFAHPTLWTDAVDTAIQHAYEAYRPERSSSNRYGTSYSFMTQASFEAEMFRYRGR